MLWWNLEDNSGSGDVAHKYSRCWTIQLARHLTTQSDRFGYVENGEIADVVHFHACGNLFISFCQGLDKTTLITFHSGCELARRVNVHQASHCLPRSERTECIAPVV